MSSTKNESHLMSNISRLQGSWDPSPKEMGPEGPEEMEVSFQETLRVELSSSPEFVLTSPMYKTYMLIEAKILQLQDQYEFPNTFHVHVPRLKDQVTSCPTRCLAMYEEFFMSASNFSSIHFFYKCPRSLLSHFDPTCSKLVPYFIFLCHPLSFPWYSIPNIFVPGFHIEKASQDERLVVHRLSSQASFDYRPTFFIHN